MAEKIVTSLADKEQRIEIGKKDRMLAKEHYSLEPTKKRTLELYDSLLN